MTVRHRFIASVTAASRVVTTELPFTRGLRRQDMIARSNEMQRPLARVKTA